MVVSPVRVREANQDGKLVASQRRRIIPYLVGGGFASCALFASALVSLFTHPSVVSLGIILILLAGSVALGWASWLDYRTQRCHFLTGTFEASPPFPDQWWSTPSFFLSRLPFFSYVSVQGQGMVCDDPKLVAALTDGSTVSVAHTHLLRLLVGIELLSDASSPDSPSARAVRDQIKVYRLPHGTLSRIRSFSGTRWVFIRFFAYTLCTWAVAYILLAGIEYAVAPHATTAGVLVIALAIGIIGGATHSRPVPLDGDGADEDGTSANSGAGADTPESKGAGATTSPPASTPDG